LENHAKIIMFYTMPNIHRSWVGILGIQGEVVLTLQGVGHHNGVRAGEGVLRMSLAFCGEMGEVADPHCFFLHTPHNLTLTAGVVTGDHRVEMISLEDQIYDHRAENLKTHVTFHMHQNGSLKMASKHQIDLYLYPLPFCDLGLVFGSFPNLSTAGAHSDAPLRVP